MRARHPVGSTRYCGDPSRGEDHCRCTVVSHSRRGDRVFLLRGSSGAIFAQWGGVFETMAELERYRGRRR
jgi:hypothetical protein